MLFAAALLPSALFLLANHDEARTGLFHDDSIYFISAKALASGHGYRIESLPDRPLQTKYPPLFPLLLSLVWRFNPNFPANVSWACVTVWCSLPVFLYLARRIFNGFGFREWETWVLCLFAAWTPMTVLLSSSLMCELLFSVLLMGTILALERATLTNSNTWAAFAGALGGLAFLTRSSGLALLLSAIAVFLLRRRFSLIFRFAGPMLLCVLAWESWAHMHQQHATDLVHLYYTDYTGMWWSDLRHMNLAVMVWKNLDSFTTISRLVVFSVTDTMGARILAWMVTIASITGVVKLAARTGKLHFAFFGFAFTVQHLIWDYPPNERMLFPLLPLVIAGFWTELRHIAHSIHVSFERPAFSEKVAACVCSTLLASVVAWSLWCMYVGDTLVLPLTIAENRKTVEHAKTVDEWIRNNSAADASFFGNHDDLIYLETGRHAFRNPVPPSFLYNGDTEQRDAYLLASVSGTATTNRAAYAVVLAHDGALDLGEHGYQLWRTSLVNAPGFRPVYQSAAGTVYRTSVPN